MDISEWLNTRIEIATANRDDDTTIGTKVEVNQDILAAVIVAMKANDIRLQAIEAKLGFKPFNM